MRMGTTLKAQTTINEDTIPIQVRIGTQMKQIEEEVKWNVSEIKDRMK